MSDADLQRTVNRGIALLLLPLSALVVGTGRFVWSDVYGASPPTAFGTLAFVVVPTLLFVGAFAYLLVSGSYSLLHRLAPDADTES